MTEKVDTFLSWENFRIVKAFITSELNMIGFQVALSDWEAGQMMVDTLDLKKDETTIHIFLSIRRPFSFGFGIAQYKPTYKNICNDTFPFDENYQNTIKTFLAKIKE